MYIPKKYGLSRVDGCPFCGGTSIVKNDQGVPVCQTHKKTKLDNLKCVCGSWLDLQTGKWGPYFRCLKCGNINFKKALEVNPQIRLPENKDLKETKGPVKNEPKKEIIITSNDVEYFA